MRQSFTLIELLVVISLIALFTAVGVPAFRNYGQKRQLNQAAEQVKSAILEAKSMALAPSAGSNPDYYEIKGFTPLEPEPNTLCTANLFVFQGGVESWIKSYQLPVVANPPDNCPTKFRIRFSVAENGKIIEIDRNGLSQDLVQDLIIQFSLVSGGTKELKVSPKSGLVEI
ncbi:prepilin-type N-terminal cleavage/methylation domain-containing protein, partial [Candidatus Berkelbacteria bacterium]|nr:prepilin-type N-terminal cleavage/methylation domain-containing protein [Candidatus Berkelbacteria bacterium]